MGLDPAGDVRQAGQAHEELSVIGFFAVAFLISGFLLYFYCGSWRLSLLTLACALVPQKPQDRPKKPNPPGPLTCDIPTRQGRDRSGLPS